MHLSAPDQPNQSLRRTCRCECLSNDGGTNDRADCDRQRTSIRLRTNTSTPPSTSNGAPDYRTRQDLRLGPRRRRHAAIPSGMPCACALNETRSHTAIMPVNIIILNFLASSFLYCGCGRCQAMYGVRTADHRHRGDRPQSSRVVQDTNFATPRPLHSGSRSRTKFKLALISKPPRPSA